MDIFPRLLDLKEYRLLVSSQALTHYLQHKMKFYVLCFSMAYVHIYTHTIPVYQEWCFLQETQ